MVKIIRLSFVALLLVLFLPHSTEAAVIWASQGDFSHHSDYMLVNGSGGPVPYWQGLGHGLSGVVDQVHIKLDFGFVPSGPMEIQIIQCDYTGSENPVSACNNPLTVFSGDFSPTASTSADYYVSSGDGGATVYSGILSADKSYFLEFYDTATENLRFRVYGSLADTWDVGVIRSNCYFWNLGSTFNCSVITDIGFDLSGFGTASDLSHVVQIVSPLNNSTSSTDTITFDTKFYASANNNVSRWYFRISDRTTNDVDFGGVPITIYGTASNGNFEISRDLNLTEGHDYVFTPSLYSVSSQITYGGQSVFFHVGSTTVTYFPTSTSSPPASSNGYETTTPTDIGSVPVIVNYVQGNVAVNALVHVFPFSYIYDSLVIVSELEGATTTSGVISFVTPSLFGHQPTTTPFVIANFNSLPDKDLIDSIRYWISAGLWIMFAMYVPWIILKAL